MMNTPFEQQLESVAIKKIGITEFNATMKEIFKSGSDEEKLRRYYEFVIPIAKEHVSHIRRDMIADRAMM